MRILKFSEYCNFIILLTRLNRVLLLILLYKRGKSVACGWLEDKFGVSWQVVPEIMGVMRNDPDQNKVDKVMNVLLTMTKLDIEELKTAFNN